MTQKAAEVKDAEPEIAGVGLKWGGNGAVYKSEVKPVFLKFFICFIFKHKLTAIV